MYKSGRWIILKLLLPFPATSTNRLKLGRKWIAPSLDTLVIVIPMDPMSPWSDNILIHLQIKEIYYSFRKADRGPSHAERKMVFSFREEKKRKEQESLLFPQIGKKNYGHACVMGKWLLNKRQSFCQTQKTGKNCSASSQCPLGDKKGHC